MLLAEVYRCVFDRVVRLVDNDGLTGARSAKRQVSVDHAFLFYRLATETQLLSTKSSLLPHVHQNLEGHGCKGIALPQLVTDNGVESSNVVSQNGVAIVNLRF